jgi:hypothetical protein
VANVLTCNKYSQKNNIGGPQVPVALFGPASLADIVVQQRAAVFASFLSVTGPPHLVSVAGRCRSLVACIPACRILPDSSVLGQ